VAPKPHRSDLTPQDLQALAARIRAHFEPPLQDIAEGFALQIAPTAGLRAKLLRPETTLDEILSWLGTDSLDKLEVIMAIEEQLGIEVPDDSAVTTFRDLVVQIARRRGVV
jgi:acyl carrier protein